MIEPAVPSKEDKSKAAVAPAPSNPFLDSAVAETYEAWYTGPGRQADRLEKLLLKRLLARFPGSKTILEIGCGTGHFTRWFTETAFASTGLDSSSAMLEVARRMDATSYMHGDALSLPFPDQQFDLSAMITTLEFVADPVRALAEAVRVARRGVLLGVLNSHSVLAWQYRRSGKPIWKSARFFGVKELLHLVHSAAGPRIETITWRTTLWPLPGVTDLPLPWGGFIGMAVQLRPQATADLKSA